MTQTLLHSVFHLYRMVKFSFRVFHILPIQRLRHNIVLVLNSYEYYRVQYRSEDRPVLLEYRLCFESRLSAKYRLYLLALLEPAVVTNHHS